MINRCDFVLQDLNIVQSVQTPCICAHSLTTLVPLARICSSWRHSVPVCQIICPQLYLSLDNVPGVGDTVRFRQIVVLHALLHIGVDDVINLPKYVYF